MESGGKGVTEVKTLGLLEISVRNDGLFERHIDSKLPQRMSLFY